MPLPALLALPAGIMGVITVVQCIFTILSILVTIVMAFAGFDNLLSIATDVKGPAGQIVDYMYSLITGFIPYSLDNLYTTLDNALQISGENSPFTPPLTFSGLTNTLAFNETFNSCIMALIEGLIFVINVRFLRWSIGNLRVKFKRN